MAEPIFIFDDYEKELLRFFAQRYRAHQEEVKRDELPRHQEVDENIEAKALVKIAEAGLIEPIDRSEVRVLPACVEKVHAWDNPPLPDYWDRSTKWFRSNPWLVVFGLVVVVLSALVPLITNIVALIRGSSPK